MEGYKSFKEAVLDASNNARVWKYAGKEDEIYKKEELLEMGDFYDKTFPLDEWNYFVVFPDGEIGLLATQDGAIDRLFLPIVPAAKKQVPQQRAAGFCSSCGSPLKGGEKFCPVCGSPVAQMAGSSAAISPAKAAAASASSVKRTAPGLSIPSRMERPYKPGFSDKLNDPALRKAMKKNGKIGGFISFLLILLPIPASFVISIMKDEPDILKAGLLLSALMLFGAVYTSIKRKAERPWQGTVTEKYVRKNKDDDNVWVVICKTDKGKKKTIEAAHTAVYDYLQVGDRIRYLPQFDGYYEKYDKSADGYSICPVCRRKNPLSEETCACGAPVFK